MLTCCCLVYRMLQLGARMGHLDVVTKLVELGADWPHGKGVDEESDVVTLLVEHYKGPRKMQVRQTSADITSVAGWRADLWRGGDTVHPCSA